MVSDQIETAWLLPRVTLSRIKGLRKQLQGHYIPWDQSLSVLVRYSCMHLCSSTKYPYLLQEEKFWGRGVSKAKIFKGT